MLISKRNSYNDEGRRVDETGKKTAFRRTCLVIPVRAGTAEPGPFRATRFSCTRDARSRVQSRFKGDARCHVYCYLRRNVPGGRRAHTVCAYRVRTPCARIVCACRVRETLDGRNNRA